MRRRKFVVLIDIALLNVVSVQVVGNTAYENMAVERKGKVDTAYRSISYKNDRTYEPVCPCPGIDPQGSKIMTHYNLESRTIIHNPEL